MNKLNWLDRERLLGVVFTFKKVHSGNLGATGDIVTRNSYTIIDKNKVKLTINIPLLQICQESEENSTIV